MYEEILISNGIHYPMTKSGFETCYRRYQVLGGKKEFKFMGSQNGIAWAKKKANGRNGMPSGEKLQVASGGYTNTSSFLMKK